VPAARPEGLGAVVASVVPVGGALVVAGAVLAGCAAVGAVFGPYGVLRFASAVVLALLAAEALLRHCVRRFGGVTGDVFGALAETACTVTLVVLAFGG
jgi:adenosylcobinamide-GDP ribazoletransferase